jgi:hypothetical protein
VLTTSERRSLHHSKKWATKPPRKTEAHYCLTTGAFCSDLDIIQCNFPSPMNCTYLISLHPMFPDARGIQISYYKLFERSTFNYTNLRL